MNTKQRVEPPFLFFHASNLVTYFSIFAGIMSLLQASRGHWYGCGGWLAVSVISDFMDGRFARLFKRRENLKKFGGELDSLADGLVFGLIPFISAYELLRPEVPGLEIPFFAAGFFYLLATLTRLGVYNIAQDEEGFVGLPAPIAALFWVFALFFHPSAAVGVGFFLGVGILMVSPFRIPRPPALLFVILTILAAAAAIGHFWMLSSEVSLKL